MSNVEFLDLTAEEDRKLIQSLSTPQKETHSQENPLISPQKTTSSRTTTSSSTTPLPPAPPRRNPSTPAPEIQMPQCSSQISTGEAKELFFLTSGDLSSLPFERGGWGSGQLRIYRTSDVKQKALEKYGPDGFARKLQAKHEKEEKKRKRDSLAKEAEAQITSSAPARADPSTVALCNNIRKSLKGQFKKQLGCVESGAPNSFRIEVPGVTPQVFAALIDRPYDTTLSSIPKHGAYHTIRFPTLSLLRIPSLQDIHKDAGGIDLNPAEECELKYKPSGMLLSIHCDSEFDHQY